MSKVDRLRSISRAIEAGWAFDDGAPCTLCGRTCCWLDGQRRRMHPWCAERSASARSLAPAPDAARPATEALRISPQEPEI